MYQVLLSNNLSYDQQLGIGMAIIYSMSRQPKRPLNISKEPVNSGIKALFKGRFLVCYRQATLVGPFGNAKTVKVYYGNYEADENSNWHPTVFSRN